MNPRHPFTIRLVLSVLLITALAGTTLAAAQQENLLYSFQGPSASSGEDGANPFGDLIADDHGNLYGTTYGGGICLLAHHIAYPCGTVFQLSPPATAGGLWTETVLYEFGTSPLDGSDPAGTLVRDSRGNLYGTTRYSGQDGVSGQGCGTFFKLSPPAKKGGQWTETILYNFQGNDSDGCGPFGTLVADSKGNIFGVTTEGGGTGKTDDTGGVFEMSPPATEGGSWTESFTRPTGPGYFPSGGLAIDSHGKLFGVMNAGGAGSAGTVYDIIPPSTPGGTWITSTLYEFKGGTDGSSPAATLRLDGAGRIYGTTFSGGAANFGTVFRLAPPTNGSSWSKTTLYSFQGGSDGRNPQARMVFDAVGHLYGTTVYGGGAAACSSFGGCGTIFRLSQQGHAWSEQTVYRFQGPSADGSYPSGLQFHDGAIYGTTLNGGTVSPYFFGSIFKLGVK